MEKRITNINLSSLAKCVALCTSSMAVLLLPLATIGVLIQLGLNNFHSIAAAFMWMAPALFLFYTITTLLFILFSTLLSVICGATYNFIAAKGGGIKITLED